MAKLCECEYLSENDFDYLRGEEEWIERLRAKALNDYEIGQLKKLMADLKTCGMAHISDMFAVGPLKFYFNKQDFTHSARNASGLQGTASQDKFQVKAAFIATIIRFLILKEGPADVDPCQDHQPQQSEDRCHHASNDRETFLGKYGFLSAELGSPTELTWLNRFERSLRYLKRFVPPERNKILYLTVGNHLEGSTVYTTYITGGANRPETERRVRIFDTLCQVQPRKRTRKPEDPAAAAAVVASLASSTEVGTTLLTGLKQSAEYPVLSSKKKQRNSEASAGLTTSKSADFLAVSSSPTGFDFSAYLSRQSSSDSLGGLGLLLAAVETQIKADAIDLDEDHQEQLNEDLFMTTAVSSHSDLTISSPDRDFSRNEKTVSRSHSGRGKRGGETGKNKKQRGSGGTGGEEEADFSLSPVLSSRGGGLTRRSFSTSSMSAALASIHGNNGNGNPSSLFSGALDYNDGNKISV